jgi:alpha-beta hydrolase superfamily lysophospholipase
MSDSLPRQLVVRDADGLDATVWLFEPAGPPSRVIQVLHGLGEHAGRYARFAAAATGRGLAVAVHDHRGHGQRTGMHAHFADHDGWQKVNADVERVNEAVRAEFPGTPLVLLGHSMGSYIAQAFAMHYGPRLSGLILSASTWSPRRQLLPALGVARLEAWRLGNRGFSRILNHLGFGKFNKPFAPARTGHDWLSRDADEVDRYEADPLCGGPYSNRLWLDLIGGLLYITSDHALSRIPADLPVLITGGELDPVGGDAGMTRLAMHYAQTLHQRITVKIYAQGRHEMLNELNRDEVTADWLDWVETTTRSAHSG